MLWVLIRIVTGGDSKEHPQQVFIKIWEGNSKEHPQHRFL